MKHTNYISRTEAAELLGVDKQTIMYKDDFKPITPTQEQQIRERWIAYRHGDG